MIVGYSTQSNRSDFTTVVPANLAAGSYFFEARQATAPVVFTLKKDGVVVKTQSESQAPLDQNGGTAYSFTSGSYELTTKDKTNQTIVTTFTVGTVTPPPVKPVVEVDLTANPDEVELIVRVNGQVR